MLVVCANLVGLLLVKAAARQEELGVRLALGVTRAGCSVSFLAESLTLGMLGGRAASLWHRSPSSDPGLALGAVPAQDRKPEDGRQDRSFHPCSFAGDRLGVRFGSRPVVDPARARSLLRPGAGNGFLDRGRTRLQEIFVVGQISISLVLLISTGLFVRTLMNLQSLDPGFEPGRVVDLRIDLLSPGYSEAREARGAAFYDQLLKEVQKLPGVDSAALRSRFPLAQATAGGLSDLAPGWRFAAKSFVGGVLRRLSRPLPHAGDSASARPDFSPQTGGAPRVS